ncbi:PIG-L family deacetylase [Shewanella sp. VB17]|uniref:PIG-L deacetylase family protein n=1 Tax=Shewanella sp. VB17 TaxID=2739432 RepID=UPI00156432F2|nr:PIG-L family deacetylase [Shewanella sp. VB17]NRD72362.1 PIG-L family deacetylase [Shewanella sp. VB17]
MGLKSIPLAAMILFSVSGCYLNGQTTSTSGARQVEVTKKSNSLSVMVIFAHPDDETWISGTLAKLVANDVAVIPVYVTSGDAGSDYSGQNLSGAKLAQVREKEAMTASQILGLEPPHFLRFPDGKTHLHHQRIAELLSKIVTRKKPLAIFTFAEGGITDNRDHKTIHKLVSVHFSALVSYFAVSDSHAESLAISASKFGVDYRIAKPVKDALVSIRIDVSPYKVKKIEAMASHKTQFPPIMVKAYEEYADSVPVEEMMTVNEDNLFTLLRRLK